MSLNLDGIVKPVPLADGGIYMSSDGTMKSVGRSGRKCLGMIFDLLLGTQTGGLQCQQTMSFGGIVYQDDKEDNINALTLNGLINFGALYAGIIARLSNGVIFRLSSRLGLYRNDERYSVLGNEIDTGFFKVDCPAYVRRGLPGEDPDSEFNVVPHVKSDFLLKIPFLGNVDSYLNQLILNYDDYMMYTININRAVKVHYSLGYLKFDDVNKSSVVGVCCNHIVKGNINRQNNVFPISFSNNDSGSGVFVLGSSNYSLSDTIISEKYNM